MAYKAFLAIYKLTIHSFSFIYYSDENSMVKTLVGTKVAVGWMMDVLHHNFALVRLSSNLG
jgi:hypothetical protein